MEHETFPTQNSIFQEAQTPACQNCGAVVSGRFCAACGQKYPQERFTVKALLHSAYEHTFEFDRGFFFTLRELFLHPARVIRDYLAGRRSIYANPVKYLAILLGISTVLTFAFLDTEKFTKQTYQQMVSQQTAKVSQKQMRRLQEAQADLSALQLELFQYPQLMYALLVPLLSAFTLLFFRRSGFNYAENLVFNTYISAQSIVLFVPFYPLYKILPDQIGAISQWGLLAAGLYFAGSGAVFFKRKSYLMAGLKAFAAYCLAYLLFSLVFGVVGFAYFFVTSK